MSDRMRPLSFDELMALLLEEFHAHGSIFGVTELWQAGRPRLPIFGNRIESPIGPAAGPNTQMAQNIIAAYAAGARFFELKTVQALDGEDLRVDKPCIGGADETYNVEWSTELTVPQAFDEYVKAWYAIKLISAEFGLGLPDGFVFNMSVGYNLAGIQSKKLDDFIEGLKSAEYTPVWRECENWIRGHLDEFERLDGMYVSDISPEICSSVTLSTLHGCPPEEIESIASYLITEKKLSTFVKLNPTLLGWDEARGTLDALGYTGLAVDPAHFKDDMQYEDARPMLHRLQDMADANRLLFGVKISNTLPVEIKRGELPGGEMYMSGKGLFPLSFALTEKIARDFGGGLRVSYSGGADIHTVKTLFDCGVWPITVASDMLRPGGFGRLTQMVEAVAECEYLPFSGILTDDLSAIEDEIAGTERWRYKPPVRPKKIEGPIPLMDCFAAPCRFACPIMQDVPAYLRLMRQGKKQEALRVIMERNPLPFTTGTICPHFCMDACARGAYECPLDIRGTKLAAAGAACFDLLDEAAPSNQGGEPVAIVGAGPAGLAASYFFARAGWAPVVFDREAVPGGTVRRVIPPFRIEDKAIEWDCALIQAQGVALELGHEITSVSELREMGFDKIVLATGAESAIPLKLSSGKTVPALDFLYRFKQDRAALEEETVGNIVVVGGGNTAVDTARAAKRLANVDKVTIVYRRSKADAPVSLDELAEAAKEGVSFEEYLIPTGIRSGCLYCHRAAPGEPDKSGRPSVVDTGERTKLPADCVIAAIGERADSPLFDEVDAGVYIIGDAATGPETVVQAIAGAAELCEKLTHRSYDKYAYANKAETLGFLDERGIIKEPRECAVGERCLECGTVCEACAECCPNRANVRVTLPDGSRQVLHLDALCNECGNCARFCPYDGLPYRDKFTLFLDDESFAKSQNDGFMPTGEAKICRIRLGGKAFKFDPINGPSGVLDEYVRTFIRAVLDEFPRFLGLEGD